MAISGLDPGIGHGHPRLSLGGISNGRKWLLVKPTAVRLSADAGARSRRASCACAWPRRAGLGSPNRRSLRHEPFASWPGVVPAIHVFKVSSVPPIPWMPATILSSNSGMGMTPGAHRNGPSPYTGQQWACSGYPRLWNSKRSVDFVDARGNPRLKPEDGHDGGSVRRRSAP